MPLFRTYLVAQSGMDMRTLRSWAEIGSVETKGWRIKTYHVPIGTDVEKVLQHFLDICSQRMTRDSSHMSASKWIAG
ncbi:hypothetical protein MPTK1_5g00570 [Marchantia polymorpha subsp. ruderalis]|uniref:Uncharacterized protein n=2 Tax=Marchantia polymorpha TaxID=3197 RepID=A0AAF6BDH7_MARPO|nr:hypothetical protein MARPO_0078s0056 [Marchantia polymorpha]BBN10061.1 hypothetical protein Mp_5g00570 [Marchantia polymorpha subsp. ruderalis]|eukprot:PTQ34654.1 hypothetical protein MARPO_0078s0056 [Marchantia polymorpha]